MLLVLHQKYAVTFQKNIFWYQNIKGRMSFYLGYTTVAFEMRGVILESEDYIVNY